MWSFTGFVIIIKIIEIIIKPLYYLSGAIDGISTAHQKLWGSISKIKGGYFLCPL
jgi:hypothetical protein